MMKRERLMDNPLQLKSLNHISVVCRSLQDSLHFYQDLLGFSPIRRPGSFDFDGAWLFNYGMGVHLLQSEDPKNMPKITHINPKDNHISFQCESIGAVEKKLKEMKIEYVKGRVEEGGIYVEQVFFHDPDGSMIEICNCDVLPVIPISIPIPIPAVDHNTNTNNNNNNNNNNNVVSAVRPCSLINCNLNQNSTISCSTS